MGLVSIVILFLLKVSNNSINLFKTKLGIYSNQQQVENFDFIP